MLRNAAKLVTTGSSKRATATATAPATALPARKAFNPLIAPKPVLGPLVREVTKRIQAIDRQEFARLDKVERRTIRQKFVEEIIEQSRRDDEAHDAANGTSMGAQREDLRTLYELNDKGVSEKIPHERALEVAGFDPGGIKEYILRNGVGTPRERAFQAFCLREENLHDARSLDPNQDVSEALYALEDLVGPKDFERMWAEKVELARGDEDKALLLFLDSASKPNDAVLKKKAKQPTGDR